MAGASVVDAGLASTDLIYFAAGRLDAPGAMFTASHNPAQYNGIKLCKAGAAPVGQDTGLNQIKAAVAEGRLERAGTPGTVEKRSLIDDFAAHVRSFVDVSRLAPMTVVADTANGMGGLVVPIVFDGLPFDLEVMYGELDGTFPNHPPDPINPELAVALAAAAGLDTAQAVLERHHAAAGGFALLTIHLRSWTWRRAMCFRRRRTPSLRSCACFCACTIRMPDACASAARICAISIRCRSGARSRSCWRRSRCCPRRWR